MANHLAGEVAVKALGRDLVFYLGVNEMIETQNALGLAGQDDAFLSVFNEDQSRNLGRRRAIALHGLKRHQPEITEHEAGDLIVELGLVRFNAIVAEALRWALPPKDEGVLGGELRPSPGPASS